MIAQISSLKLETGGDSLILSWRITDHGGPVQAAGQQPQGSGRDGAASRPRCPAAADRRRGRSRHRLARRIHPGRRARQHGDLIWQHRG